MCVLRGPKREGRGVPEAFEEAVAENSPNVEKNHEFRKLSKYQTRKNGKSPRDNHALRKIEQKRRWQRSATALPRERSSGEARRARPGGFPGARDAPRAPPQ